MFDVTLRQPFLPVTKPTSVRLPPLNNLSISFRVSDTLLSSLFDWLRALPRSSLRRLAVRPPKELSLTIGEAIESFAARLDSLDLTLDDSYTLTDMERLNLHRCTGLRTLSIWHQCSIPLAEILDLVAPSSRIHQLRLHVRVSQPEPEWVRVRNVLASERFCQLQEVVFLLPPDEDDRLGPQKQRTVMGAVEDLRHRDVSVRVSNWSPPFRTI
ncbi:hypothetical protein SCP_0706010 [Sparassis crispa]|uniref:F-box domain-containing protein n=1 Tax=Sparassis crispa TaxID=139825 RepID=A0A401GUK7_9APHY|nr:hypothetical protein SCP_0706010 [Sparassis crispa]GBE85414.1 hypothetical protein SCP_0706010 [Sparassis crispa]